MYSRTDIIKSITKTKESTINLEEYLRENVSLNKSKYRIPGTKKPMRWKSFLLKLNPSIVTTGLRISLPFS
jgi:hypothetical protein